MVMRAFFAGRSITTRPTAACESFFFRYSRTRMSSASMPGKFLEFAYHFEPQLRFTERRKPVGLIFCPRSEEHTSELQSHVNLVCRLLLEKKKKKKKHYILNIHEHTPPH